MRYQILMVLSACAFLSGQAANPDEWPVNHNIGQNCLSPTTKLKPPLKMKWAAKIPGKFWNGPVVAEGKVVVQDESGYLFCLDAETGELVWRYYVVSGYTIVNMSRAPSIFNHRVYSTFESAWNDINCIYCLDLVTGDLLWKKPTGKFDNLFSVGIPNARGSSPQYAQGRVFYVSNVNINGTSYPGPYNYKNQVQCWDAVTGDSLWTHTMWDTACHTSSILVMGDTVFVSAGGPGQSAGRTAAFDLYGKLLWSTAEYHVKYMESTCPIAYHAGELWVKTNTSSSYPLQDTMSVLNTSDGSLKFKRIAPLFSRPIAFMGDRYYSRTICQPPTDYGITTGVPVETPFRLFAGDAFGNGCSPVVAGNGYLYAGFGPSTTCQTGYQYYAWDAATGEPVWRFPNSSNMCTEAAIAYDKLYMATTADGLIYCFENDE